MKILNQLLVISVLFFVACGNKDDSTNNEIPSPNTEESIETTIRVKLNSVRTDTDFTLIVKSENNKLFTYNKGNSTDLKLYRSASTSKWVTSAIILSLVKEGILSLDDHPQEYISSWNNSGNLSKITLKNLLNFTSGLNNEPLCVNFANYDFENCVNNISEKNQDAKTPGEEFYYTFTHLQVAGLMAIKASGKSSWQELFKDFQTTTGLFKDSSYDLPSLSNPKLAAGMHWNAKEYLAFLEALYKEDILTPQLIKMMTTNQLSTAKVEYSPALESINEDWHYGFGTWIECHNIIYNCSQRTKVSSPGAYGAYPFIDYEHNYYGVLAREGKLGTFTKGYELFKTVSDDLETWVKEN